MTTDADKIAALRSTRCDYEEEHEWLKFLLDAYASTGGFAGKVKPTAIAFFGWAAEAYSNRLASAGAPAATNGPGSYIDQFPREDAEKYKQRVALAHYTNYVAPIADLLCSYVSKEQMAREGVDKTPIADWMNDVNGRGTTWDAMMRDLITLRCALLGWMPVLVDAPPVPQAIGSAAQAQAANIKIEPRVIPLFPVNLLDWQCDEAGVFIWAKLCTHHVERADAMSAPRNIERIAIWYTDRAEVYRIFKEGDQERVEGPEIFPHKFERVPVEIFRHKPTPDDPVRGIPMLHDVAVANRRLFNLESELDEHIRSSVFAILGLPMEDTTQESGSVSLGNGSILKIPMTSRQALEYVAPPPTVAATLETRIEKMERSIYRMARVEYTKPTGGAVSGAAKAYEFEQTNRRLGDFAGQLARSEQRLFRLIGHAMSMSDDATDNVQVTPPQSFRVEDLTTDLENALNAIKVKLGPTAIEQMRARLIDKMLPNLSRDLREKALKELALIDDEPEPAPAPDAPAPAPNEPAKEDVPDPGAKQEDIAA